MSKLTKADLLAQNEELRETLRRTQRALNQIEIALPDLPDVGEADNRPSYSTDHTVEALIRARSEWERVVKDPSDRVNSYTSKRRGYQLVKSTRLRPKWSIRMVWSFCGFLL